MNIGNFYAPFPKELPEEVTESLVRSNSIRIERIISKGHCSTPDFWYDQAENEWVLLMKGAARLKFHKNNEILHLAPGMYINIPAHEKHRVEWTTDQEETIWLAVFYQ